MSLQPHWMVVLQGVLQIHTITAHLSTNYETQYTTQLPIKMTKINTKEVQFIIICWTCKSEDLFWMW